MASSVPDPFIEKLTALISREVHITFRLSTFFFCAAFFTLVVYLTWEYYWYKAIGLYFIKWHTHIVTTALLFSILPVVSGLIHKVVSKTLTAKLLVVSIAVWVAFILVEILLIFNGTTHTYSENRYGYYRSPFLYDSTDIYHLVHNRDTLREFSPEFNYMFPVNSLGFPDKDWNVAKDTGVYRILTLGDSFTQGVGAPHDSSYPVILSKILTAGGIKAEVLNAGVAGSDPVFNYKNMHDRLLQYKPDLVVQAVSENDVLNDFSIMGGFERYLNDSCMRSPNITPNETLYALSHTMRLVMREIGYDFRMPGNLKTAIPAAKRGEILQTVISKYQSLAQTNGFKVLVVFFPTKRESLNHRYEFDFEAYEKLNAEGDNLHILNLFPCYSNTFTGKADIENYYWAIDAHHNSRGYALMANCVANYILEKEYRLGARN